MGLWIRVAVLCVVLCAVAEIIQAQKEAENILELAGVAGNDNDNKGYRRRAFRRPQGGRPQGGRPQGGRFGQGFRRPGLARPFRRPTKGRLAQARPQTRPLARPQARPQHEQNERRQNPYINQQQQQQSQQIQQSQKPQQNQKPQYGTVNLKPSSGLSGKFQYAQTSPVQLKHQMLKRPTTNNQQKPLSIAMPSLASLLYKYAAKSARSKPFFQNSNSLYNMFGRSAYGPLGKPAGYTQQHKKVQTSYQTRPAQQPQQRQPVYRPAVQQQSVSYQKPAAQPQQQRPAYYPPATQATPRAYPPQQQTYQPAPRPQTYQQPAPRPTYQQPAPRPTYQQPSGYAPQRQTYTSPIVNTQPRTSVQKSYYQPPPAAPACPAAGNFCYGKKAGHYAHPGSNACFIQCDAFGRGFAKGCSPGTFWKPVGPEPALWNMCT